MRKYMLFALAGLAFMACNKDDDNNNNNNPQPTPPTYEQRLEGEWQLDRVLYEASIPNPLDPFNPIDVSGEGTNVLGSHEITLNPNAIEYTYSFTAEADLGTGTPTPIPVQQSGMGEWVLNSSEDRIFITEDGETTTWEVVLNEENKQVYKAQITQAVGVLSIVVDTELTFVR